MKVPDAVIVTIFTLLFLIPAVSPLFINDNRKGK